jgi:capsular polysaccharide biosynthesis protein
MLHVAEESKKEIAELIPVHPPGKIFRKKAAIPIGCEPHPAFDILVAPQTPTYLARVPRGRVVGPTVAVLTSADRMLSDVSLDWGHPGLDHFAYRQFRLPRCTEYQGSALLLACTGADTYFHWLTDALPRLEIFAKALGTGKAPDWWVVNTINRPFIRESLALLGIPLGRVVALDKMPHVRFSELYVPSLPCEASSGDTPEWVAHFLRNKFIPPTDQNNQAQRIWIDRSTANSRKMPLTKESKNHLKAFGFEIYRLEELPFFKQVALFCSAEAVAGPHGAGFAGTIFSKDAQIVEFFDNEYVNACYYSLSCHVGAAYFYHISHLSDRIGFSYDIRDILSEGFK